MANEPVISNTSPIIKLVGVQLLDLLAQIYREVWIPDIVATEYAAGASPSDPVLTGIGWLKIHAVVVPTDLLAIQGLGAGEAAAIALALQHHARLLVIDDLLGRKVAAQQGVPIAGTLAILLRAKREGLITTVKPIIDTMIAQGRRISPQLRMDILHHAGED